jgi:hypothetical protein
MNIFLKYQISIIFNNRQKQKFLHGPAMVNEFLYFGTDEFFFFWNKLKKVGLNPSCMKVDFYFIFFKKKKHNAKLVVTKI